MRDTKNKSAKQKIEEELKSKKEYDYVLTQQERDRLMLIINTIIQADNMGVVDSRKSLNVLIDFLTKSLREKEK